MKFSIKHIPLSLLWLALFLCKDYSLASQRHKIDSLLNVLKTEKEDTNKVKTLNIVSFSLYAINPDTTIILAGQAETLSEKLGWKKGQGSALGYLGIGYCIKGNYPKGLDYYLKSLKIYEEIGNKQGQANNLGNIGNIYDDQGDYPKALDYYLKALKISEDIGNKQGQAADLGNIGFIYYDQGDYPSALDYDLKSLKIYEEIGNKQGQATNLGNIGNIYNDQGDYPSALDYDLKSLKMDEEIGNKQGQANNLGNIGSIYTTQSDYPRALDYYLKALKMEEEMGDKHGQARNLGNIGNIYKDQGDYPSALDYYLKSLKMEEEMGDKHGQAINLGSIGIVYIHTGKFTAAEEYIKQAIAIDSSIGEQNELRQYEESLTQLYDTTGRYKAALVWYKKAMKIKDTLFNIGKDKALTRKEMGYKFARQQDSVKAAQRQKDALALADKKKQDVVTYSVIGGLLLALVFSGFILRSLRVTRKQKQLIESQKALVEEKNKAVEEKNKDILDSITYAKRLQDAILPPLSLIKKYLPESFLLYKPKDIVAGDFYWMETLGDTILIAACDCTGHGVPGALVSVVCSNALNRTVKEFHITEPGKLLDKVRELVLETFEKSEGNIQDGMDISLCCINTKTNEVQWSGAYNSLWYIRNGELKDMPADKQPIGKTDKPQPFNTHNLNLQKGDTLYLFTDGFADQFGGPKGKKYKYRQLQELLSGNGNLSMNEQKLMLEKEFEKWKGAMEQTDDVCVIGIRI